MLVLLLCALIQLQTRHHYESQELQSNVRAKWDCRFSRTFSTDSWMLNGRTSHHLLTCAVQFFLAAASLMAFRCGRSRSSSWQAASYSMVLSRLMGRAMVHGRVYTTGSVTVAS